LIQFGKSTAGSAGKVKDGVRKLKSQPGKKPVLVKIIIDDLFSEMEVYLIIQHQEGDTRLDMVTFQGRHQGDHIAGLVIKVMTRLQGIIMNFAQESFFQPDPLVYL
jgi:hypothetical protein